VSSFEKNKEFVAGGYTYGKSKISYMLTHFGSAELLISIYTERKAVYIFAPLWTHTIKE
jgi:hypothetical protein